MNYVNQKHKQMNMKQKDKRLSLTVSNITSVKAAIQVLGEILKNTKEL